MADTRDGAHLRHRHDAGAWPWDDVADRRIALDGGGRTINLSVTNRSADAMPAGPGLHPCFPPTAGACVALSAHTIASLDPCGFPTPTPDDAAILRAAPRASSIRTGAAAMSARSEAMRAWPIRHRDTS